jgi:hypothetical protein
VWHEAVGVFILQQSETREGQRLSHAAERHLVRFLSWNEPAEGHVILGALICSRLALTSAAVGRSFGSSAHAVSMILVSAALGTTAVVSCSRCCVRWMKPCPSCSGEAVRKGGNPEHMYQITIAME